MSRWIRMSLPRRIIADLSHFANRTPNGVIKATVNVAALAAARQESAVRIAWPVLFLKAFALTAREVPELRRAYCKFPWPHFYEHPFTVASLVIERPHEGESALLLARVKQPDLMPLQELDALIRRLKEAPADEVRDFRRTLRIARLPLLLRRLIWWLGLNIGRQRASHFGTAAMSVLGGQGVEVVFAVSPWSLLLSYGPIAASGDVTVTISFDHRVMDGAVIARAIAGLETQLLALAGELALATEPAAPVDAGRKPA
jgi:hypothetical protein